MPTYADAAALASAVKTRNHRLHQGIVVTSDLFYPALIDGQLKTFRDAGCVAVEMECAALFVTGTLRRVRTGALLALAAWGMELTVIAFIGMILLIGIVKKNGIMMVDFAIAAERGRGLSPREAIMEACVARFRPITMTTVAAIFGALPIVFATGAGAELRRPLGVVIVGGLVMSQILTLYSTPVIYLLMDKFRRGDRVSLLQRAALEAPAE